MFGFGLMAFAWLNIGSVLSMAGDLANYPAATLLIKTNGHTIATLALPKHSQTTIVAKGMELHPEAARSSVVATGGVKFEVFLDKAKIISGEAHEVELVRRRK